MDFRKKFDLAYFICKENIALTKWLCYVNCKLMHGVQLGTGYKNNQACSTLNFDEDISQEQI